MYVNKRINKYKDINFIKFYFFLIHACVYRDFVKLQNSVYGNCYTFHPSSMNVSEVLLTSHYGLQYGILYILTNNKKKLSILFSVTLFVFRHFVLKPLNIAFHDEFRKKFKLRDNQV